MTLVADILGGCSFGHATSGGRAAGRFSRELGDSAQCHQLLSRGSSWVGGMFHAAPMLSAGLAYNDLLGPLTDAILHPQDRPSARTVARRSPVRIMPASSGAHFVPAAHSQGNASKPAGLGNFSGGGRAFSPGTATRAASGRTMPGSVRPGLVSGDFPRQRGLEQTELVRLALSAQSGGPAAMQRTGSGKRPSAASYSYNRQSLARTATVAGESVFGVSKSASGALGIDPPTPSAIRDWQSRMVDRVQVRLRSSEGGYGAVAPASRAMHDLWAQVIDGPAASSELLLPQAETFVAPAGSIDASPTGEVINVKPVVSRQAGDRGERELGAPVGRPAVLANSVASPEGAAIAALQVLSEELLSKAHDEPWLPSLIPSSRPRTEAPYASSPASLTKTEVAPLHQDLDLGEDLTELSLRMRRVLNEEARRHGIDV